MKYIHLINITLTLYEAGSKFDEERFEDSDLHDLWYMPDSHEHDRYNISSPHLLDYCRRPHWNECDEWDAETTVVLTTWAVGIDFQYVPTGFSEGIHAALSPDDWDPEWKTHLYAFVSEIFDLFDPMFDQYLRHLKKPKYLWFEEKSKYSVFNLLTAWEYGCMRGGDPEEWDCEWDLMGKAEWKFVSNG